MVLRAGLLLSLILAFALQSAHGKQIEFSGGANYAHVEAANLQEYGFAAKAQTSHYRSGGGFDQVYGVAARNF